MKLGLASFLLAATAGQAGASAPCTLVSALITPAAFKAYPARVSRGPWRPSDVRHGRAHSYRTLLRDEDREVPDFAGHFRLVKIGCGAGSMCTAIADRLSGQVTFAPELRVVSWMMGDDAVDDTPGFERLTYRPDSRLLAVFGIRNEDERTAGVTLYDWQRGRLRLVRFVPQRQLCPRRSAR